MNNDKISELSKPFEPEHISWLPAATNKDKTKCMVMAYADLRAYMNRLDDVFGSEWSNTVTPWGDKLIVSVTINGISRSSTGEPDSESVKSGNAGTVTEAQAFKRACAMWGLGRYLYELPSVWVSYDADSKRIPDADLKNLNARYERWYKDKTGTQQTQRQPQPPVIAPTLPTPQAEKKEEEVKPWLDWKDGNAAKKAALENKWCGNEFEARNSLLNSLEAITGQRESWQPGKQNEVFHHFYDKHMARKSELKEAA